MAARLGSLRREICRAESESERRLTDDLRAVRELAASEESAVDRAIEEKGEGGRARKQEVHLCRLQPSGRRGDLKCDGFRTSTGTVYQCYGPRYGQANVEDALAKIDEDFRGAKSHWGTRLREWKFVVNVYRDKLPSELVRRIEQLAEELGVPAGPLNRSDILDLIKSLPAEERERQYGRAPRATDMVRITYANLGRALTLIRRAIATDPNEPVPLSADLATKVASNALSNATRHFLSIGQTGVVKVEEYLRDQPDPEEPERMAQGFKARYAECVASGLEPDQTFREMVIFAGVGTGEAERDTAALAIVTRFFVTCQIFEIPIVSVVQ